MWLLWLALAGAQEVPSSTPSEDTTPSEAPAPVDPPETMEGEAEPATEADEGAELGPEEGPETQVEPAPGEQQTETGTETEVTPEPAPEPLPEIDPEPLAELEVVPPGTRLSTDLLLYVRTDGTFFLDDNIVTDLEVESGIRHLVADKPDLRVVIEASDNAPHGRIMKAIEGATNSGATRVAVALAGVETVDQVDPLFPGENEHVEELESGLTNKQMRQLKPKRWKFPQNPYAQTDFTAYTLEFGEIKVGLASITAGVFPRVQVGTSPALDVLGIYNANIKANLMREGPLDGAMFAQFYYAPITQLIERFDQGNSLGLSGQTDQGDVSFTSAARYVGLGAKGSLRILRPWTLHAGASYGRVEAEGQIDFQDLPDILIPGLEPIGGDVSLVPKLVGELVQVSLASDLRFNRRDSLIVRAQAPIYARARGVIGGDVGGLPDEVEDVDFVVAYGSLVPISAGYRVSASWQFSWKHVDARFGWGVSPLPWTWTLQAFDLSYRFGGKTRRSEAQIRRGYDANRRNMRRGGDAGQYERDLRRSTEPLVSTPGPRSKEREDDTSQDNSGEDSSEQPPATDNAEE